MLVTQPARIEHTIHLLPQDTSLPELERVATSLHPARSAFTYSADAAHAVAHAGNDASKVVVWAGERWKSGDIFAWLHERGVATESRNMDGTAVANHQSNPDTQRRQPVPIAHTIHLLPQDTTLPELLQVARQLHPTRSAFTYSADAAHALMAAGSDSSKVVVWSGSRWTSGDIFAWLRDRGIGFDAQRFAQPAQVESSTFVFTHWPTERRTITQTFNVNPQIYVPLGLTGHEGVDIEAPFGSQIFAVASGTVYKIRQAAEGHAYGTAVYIRHRDNYRTAYAHLKEALVHVGDVVAGGEKIGIADSTGNVFPKPTEAEPQLGSHLHLSLYLDGASARAETPQPFDLIDPTPYLAHLQQGWASPREPVVVGWAFAPSVEVAGKVGRVQTTFINLRETPGSFQKRVGRVPHGVVMRLRGGKQDNYYPVAVHQGDVVRVDTAVQVGIHDEAGAAWMKRNGVEGWSLTAVALGTTAQALDYTRFAQAGIKMLVRLNYGFHPKGNIPAAEAAEYRPFLKACAETMRRSKGVWGYIFGNETNNPQEFPGGVNGPPITPAHYANAYNQVWRNKPDGVRLGVQAVDPYFGPDSDSRAYWQQCLQNLIDTDFITIHPKTQDSDPDHIGSDRKFSDHPLTWQFLHVKAYQPLLAAMPDRFALLPVIATEVNPQRHNDQRTLGWQRDQGARWVETAVAHFKAYNEQALMPVNGVIFYRYAHDQWAFQDKQNILDAIKRAA